MFSDILFLVHGIKRDVMREFKMKTNVRSNKMLKNTYSRPELVERAILTETQAFAGTGTDAGPNERAKRGDS